jgi:hypothetical protein
MSKAEYDPRLRECLQEIEDLLKFYDAGGFVSIHSKTHGEFKVMIEHMSWSQVKMIGERKAMHIKLHMGTSPENTEATIAMVDDARSIAANFFKFFDKVLEAVKKQADVVTKPIFERINNEDRE